jgi:uncharacterized membrane protein YeaQ/YmgE (transglycosylase-associated protein family)
MEFSTVITIVRWIVIGGAAGYIASLLLRTERQGCLINIALGVVGAFIGGFIFGNFLGGASLTGWGFLDTTIHALVGSVVLLILMELILPGKQLGVRGD